jgi:hypothetical protein
MYAYSPPAPFDLVINVAHPDASSLGRIDIAKRTDLPRGQQITDHAIGQSAAFCYVMDEQRTLFATSKDRQRTEHLTQSPLLGSGGVFGIDRY